MTTKKNNKLEKDKTPLGTSSDAITNVDFSFSASKEKSIELLNGMIKDMMSGKDVQPFIIGAKNGLPVVQQLEIDEDGFLILPKIQVRNKEDILAKSKTVKRILEHIAPVLKAEIENVTYVALMRKDVTKLKEIMLNVRDKSLPVKVENRVGCIWLVIGDYEFVI
jgi:hypothetical protein